MFKAIQAVGKGISNAIKGINKLYHSRRNQDKAKENAEPLRQDATNEMSEQERVNVTQEENVKGKEEEVEQDASQENDTKDTPTKMQDDTEYDKKMKVTKGLVIAMTAITVTCALLSFTGVGVLVAICAIAICFVICKSLNRSVEKHHEQQTETSKDVDNTVHQNTDEKSQDSQDKNHDQDKSIKERLVDSFDSKVEAISYKIGETIVNIPNNVVSGFKETTSKQDEQVKKQGNEQGNDTSMQQENMGNKPSSPSR